MASTTLFNALIFNRARIPPGGAAGYWVGPDARFDTGTVAVTAHGLPGAVSGAMILGVELLKTRAEGAGGSPTPYLDITVRNHGTNYCPYVRLMVSTINP